jgi:hypothetical protein
LATAVIVAGLLTAAWCLLAAVRDRPTGYGQLAAMAVAEVLALVLGGWAVVRLVAGERPAELATFIGYLIVALLLLPAGAALSIVERTRWGAVIAGVAALVLPVLVVRLQQVWDG